MRGPAWTADERERVETLLEARLSYRRIAELLGMTRNTVIGRVLRDGELHAHYRPKPTTKPKRKRVLASKHWQHDVEPFVVAEIEPIEPQPGELKPLVALGHAECRWPMTAADVVGGQLFCGRAVAGDHTQYCAFHHREAHWRRAC
jgi:hypothetical protein